MHLDYHIQVDGAFYSVPYALIGKTVEVRLTARGIEIFHRQQRLAAHVRGEAN